MTGTSSEKRTFTLLAADKLAQQGLAFIESQPDATLINKPGLSEQDYAQMLAGGGIDAMMVRSGITVTPAMLENPGDLKVIARAGVGVDNIDLQAATAKGILVVNTAEASTITTAEHAFALMMTLVRNIGPAYQTMAQGGWDRSKYQGRQLSGKTLGVVGFGRIGQTVAQRALAFGMDVVAFDPFINAQTMLDGQVRLFNDFEKMLPHADVLSFHVPLNDATRSMLNTRTFALCRKGVFVVNASRGGVVDESDLITALDCGQCGGAALDVFTDEPPAKDSPLRSHPKLLVTPHLGASTQEAQQAVSVDAADACLTYLRGEGIKGAVNAGGLKIDLTPVQQRYVDLAQRMSGLISPMVTRGIACVTLEIAGKALAGAASMIERQVMVRLLCDYLSEPVNLINVNDVSQKRGIKVRTVQLEGDTPAPAQLTLEITGPADAVDVDTPQADKTRRIVGRVYDDMKPRVVEINGYVMDMIPAGDMAFILNEDRPGIIGTVGCEFGDAQVNIADMTISRRDDTAMMVLKLDAPVPQALMDRLKSHPSILKVASVQLCAEAE